MVGINESDQRNQDREEKHLLTLMYEVQEKMEFLLDEGKNDEHYILMDQLVKRLENYLANNNQQLL